jgi:AcrR family transcriptional regulator
MGTAEDVLGAGAPPRRRNARGEGGRLAEEIVAAAMAIIEREGTDEAVTLRSVAREVGISAPSIYAHFEDLDAILLAVCEAVFVLVHDVVKQAKVRAGSDVGDQLVAGCEAYVQFGLDHPAWYRTVFVREHPKLGSGPPPPPGSMPSLGTAAFAVLVEGIERCRAAGRSTSTDAFTDATAVWIALHGTVSLWSTMCLFPWPDREGFVRRLVVALAHLEETPAPPTAQPPAARAKKA